MKHRSFCSALAVAVVSTALLSPVAEATTLRRASLEDLARTSDVILHARVRRVDDERATSKRGPFETLIQFEIIEAVKGLPHHDGTFDVVLPGGRGFGLEARIPGMPRFAAGEEVVVILERHAQGFALAGLGQGVFRIDRTQSIPRVSRDLGDVAIVGPKTPALLPATLEGLLKELRVLGGGR